MKLIKEHIVAYGLSVLAKEQLVASKYAKDAIKKYKIDANKQMPTKVIMSVTEIKVPNNWRF